MENNASAHIDPEINLRVIEQIKPKLVIATVQFRDILEGLGAVKSSW